MRSAVLKNGKIQIIEVAKPSLDGRFGAIIKVYGCGLCGSDIVKIDTFDGKNIPKLGHEVVGEIVEININSNFKIGDIVALGHHYPCFNCKYCIHGHYSMCETFKASNIEPAGFSEFIYVDKNHLKNTVFIKPDTLPEEEFSFLEPLACCIRSIKRANVDKTQNALVIGLGSIGILTVSALRAFGVKTFGFDINQERQKFVSFDNSIKYDLIFMTSGSYQAIQTSLDLIDRGGKIIVFSSVKNNIGYENNKIYYDELEIMGSYSPSPDDLKTSMEFLRDKKVLTKGILTKYSLENLQNAIDDTKAGKILKGYIKI